MTRAVGKSFRSFAADPVVKAGSLTKTWETRLVSCVVDENVGLPDVAVLTYRDGDNELLKSADITIGTPLTVSVVAVESKAQEQLFGGEVTALEKDSDSTGSFTVIRAMSMAHRLFRGRRVEAFCNLTATEVVRKVARNAGLTVGRVQVSSVTYAQISQAGTSDWDFLQRLAHEQWCQHIVDDRLQRLGVDGAHERARVHQQLGGVDGYVCAGHRDVAPAAEVRRAAALRAGASGQSDPRPKDRWTGESARL